MTDNNVEKELLDFQHQGETVQSERDIRAADSAAEGIETAPENIRRLMDAMGPISVNLPVDVGAMWEYAVRELNQQAVSTAKAGFALLVLKEQTGHGNFLRELEARDIPERTAQNCMGVARLLLRMPKSKTQVLAHLGGTKLIELARIPSEVIEAAAETDAFAGIPLDELDRMSTRELKELVRKLRDDHERELDARDQLLDEKGQKINELSTRLNRTPTPDEQEKAERDWMVARRGELVSASMECSRAIARMGEIVSTIRQHEGSISEALLEEIPAQASSVARDLADMVISTGGDVDVGEIILPSWLREAMAEQRGETER